MLETKNKKINWYYFCVLKMKVENEKLSEMVMEDLEWRQKMCVTMAEVTLVFVFICWELEQLPQIEGGVICIIYFMGKFQKRSFLILIVVCLIFIDCEGKNNPLSFNEGGCSGGLIFCKWFGADQRGRQNRHHCEMRLLCLSVFRS